MTTKHKHIVIVAAIFAALLLSAYTIGGQAPTVQPTATAQPNHADRPPANVIGDALRITTQATPTTNDGFAPYGTVFPGEPTRTR